MPGPSRQYDPTTSYCTRALCVQTSYRSMPSCLQRLEAPLPMMSVLMSPTRIFDKDERKTMEETTYGFLDFYKKQLEKLGLQESSQKPWCETPRMLYKKRPWPFASRCVGQVTKFPELHMDGTVTGYLQVVTGLKGPLWELAEAYETKYGLESEVVISPDYK